MMMALTEQAGLEFLRDFYDLPVQQQQSYYWVKQYELPDSYRLSYYRRLCTGAVSGVTSAATQLRIGPLPDIDNGVTHPDQTGSQIMETIAWIIDYILETHAVLRVTGTTGRSHLAVWIRTECLPLMASYDRRVVVGTGCYWIADSAETLADNMEQIIKEEPTALPLSIGVLRQYNTTAVSSDLQSALQLQLKSNSVPVVGMAELAPFHYGGLCDLLADGHLAFRKDYEGVDNGDMYLKCQPGPKMFQVFMSQTPDETMAQLRALKIFVAYCRQKLNDATFNVYNLRTVCPRKGGHFHEFSVRDVHWVHINAMDETLLFEKQGMWSTESAKGVAGLISYIQRDSMRNAFDQPKRPARLQLMGNSHAQASPGMFAPSRPAPPPPTYYHQQVPSPWIAPQQPHMWYPPQMYPQQQPPWQ